MTSYSPNCHILNISQAPTHPTLLTSIPLISKLECVSYGSSQHKSTSESYLQNHTSWGNSQLGMHLQNNEVLTCTTSSILIYTRRHFCTLSLQVRNGYFRTRLSRSWREFEVTVQHSHFLSNGLLISTSMI